MRDLGGKVAVITGGASGIGRAMAERFAAEGMRLVLGDIEEPALAATTEALSAAGATVLGVPTDVSRLSDVQALADRALATYGAVHLVCNNAGVGGGPAQGTPIEVWEWVLGVNLWGVINGCHVFLPILSQQGEGHIVNTASLAGLTGVPGLAVYCTSKFGVVGLSESLHQELAASASPVKVSVLCPGFVHTRIAESERNMPEAARRVEADAPEMFEPAVRRGIETGIDPATVAETVYQAVIADRFYILTHERAAVGGMKARLAWMTGGEAPTVVMDVRPN